MTWSRASPHRPLPLLLCEATRNPRRAMRGRRDTPSRVHSSSNRLASGHVVTGARPPAQVSPEPQSGQGFSVTLIWLPDPSRMWDSDSASPVQACCLGGAPTFLPAGHQVQAAEPSSTDMGEGPTLWPLYSSSVPLGIKATH